METATIEQIDERLRKLPPEKLAVVLEFVTELAQQPLLSEGRETALLSEAALRKIWDTAQEDEAWRHLPADEAALEAGYRAMAADAEREREAREWIEAAPDEALE